MSRAGSGSGSSEVSSTTPPVPILPGVVSAGAAGVAGAAVSTGVLVLVGAAGASGREARAGAVDFPAFGSVVAPLFAPLFSPLFAPLAAVCAAFAAGAARSARRKAESATRPSRGRNGESVRVFCMRHPGCVTQAPLGLSACLLPRAADAREAHQSSSIIVTRLSRLVSHDSRITVETSLAARASFAPRRGFARLAANPSHFLRGTQPVASNGSRISLTRTQKFSLSTSTSPRAMRRPFT